jgi:amino acid adenylation domain-containing protein
MDAPRGRLAPPCCRAGCGQHDQLTLSLRVEHRPPCQGRHEQDSVKHLGNTVTLLNDLFTVVSAKPDAVAVHDRQPLSYHQLWHHAGSMARALRTAGCPIGGRVVLGLPPGRQWVAGLVGIWRAGGVPVLSNGEHPEERLRQIADGADYVLADPLTSTRQWPDHLELVLFEDEVESGRAVAPLDSAAVSACVLHTSGTSGRPKAVVLGHEGLAHRITTLRALYEIGVDDRIAQLAAPCTDVILWETLLALMAGARIEIPLGLDRVPGQELARWLDQRDITVASMTPTMLAAMPEVDLPALRLIVLGGERLDPRRHGFWIERHQVANAYGPTEATIETHVCPQVCGDSPALIGHPVDGVDDFVLSESGDPVEDGQIGELYLGGVGLALRYDGLPEATTAAFPAVRIDGRVRRLYRTGDLVFRQPDGQMVFVDRRDRQLNIGGVRLEPAEVEQVALRLSGVTAAAAFAEDEAERQTLVLHVGVRKGGPSAVKLRARLAQLLPASAVPSRIHVHLELPTTDSGKPDILQLRRGPANGTGPGSPVGRVTLPEQVARWWLDATGSGPEWGVEFFDSADSLAAVRLVHQVNENFRTAITITDFVADPTPNMLARVLADRSEEAL